MITCWLCMTATMVWLGHCSCLTGPAHYIYREIYAYFFQLQTMWYCLENYNLECSHYSTTGRTIISTSIGSYYLSHRASIMYLLWNICIFSQLKSMCHCLANYNLIKLENELLLLAYSLCIRIGCKNISLNNEI